MKFSAITLSLLIFVVLSFKKGEAKSNPVKNEQTKILYNKLIQLSGKGIMFGMANPTSISYADCKNTDINQSDCKDITGSHPAFFESDFMWYNDIEFKKNDLEAMKAAYNRGAVCGYCWHLRGKESNSFYAKDGDKTLLHDIVSNLDRKTNSSLDWYLKKLDSEVVSVFKELGFPIVFRPFHEMNGSWFWWGKNWCTTSEYKIMYRLTVDYLREAGLTNILYVWSPDAASAMEFYPGDNYVDVLGMDIYEPGIDPFKSHPKMLQALGILTDYAAEHGKVVAITECGCRKDEEIWRYPDLYPDFWTKYVLEPILNDERARRIVWISSWYSADWSKDNKGQYYIPYKKLSTPKGIECIADFKKFYNNPATIFEDNLPDMYHMSNNN